MLKNAVRDALNRQMNLEYFSSYLYLSMSTYFEKNSFPGMAAWMRKQGQEEMEHVLKFYRFLFDRESEAEFEAVAKPSQNWKSVADVFAKALAHEVAITASIHKLFALASKETDYATQQFLQWFISEQVEEEASVREIVQKLKLLGNDSRSLYLLDKELASR